jgi:hypothetical protein
MCLFGALGILPFLPVILGGIVVAVAIWLMHRYEKKRTESMSNIAEELGLTFFPEGHPDLVSKLQLLPIFNKGRDRKMRNLMTAETEETQLAIFDYQYTTGGGKNQHTHKSTIASMIKDDLRLPHFSVRPEGFFDRVGAVVGFQDINFDDHPDFSRAYVLKGENEAAIRSFFTKDMLDLFASKKDVMVEAGGNVICFRRKGRQSPEQIADFMAECYEFMNAVGTPETTA